MTCNLAEKGVDPEARAAAQAALRYFEKAATNHNEDEERDLPEFFNRWLDDGDRQALGRSMGARRRIENRAG